MPLRLHRPILRRPGTKAWRAGTVHKSDSRTGVSHADRLSNATGLVHGQRRAQAGGSRSAHRHRSLCGRHVASRHGASGLRAIGDGPRRHHLRRHRGGPGRAGGCGRADGVGPAHRPPAAVHPAAAGAQPAAAGRQGPLRGRPDCGGGGRVSGGGHRRGRTGGGGLRAACCGDRPVRGPQARRPGGDRGPRIEPRDAVRHPCRSRCDGWPRPDAEVPDHQSPRVGSTDRALGRAGRARHWRQPRRGDTVVHLPAPPRGAQRGSRGPRNAAGERAGHRSRCRRRIRFQVPHLPGVRHRGMAGPAPGPACQMDRDPQREPDQHGPGTETTSTTSSSA